jgi:hypothetical protein
VKVAARRTLDHEPSLRQLRGTTWTNKEGDVAARFEQTSAKISTDGACADDESSHCRKLREIVTMCASECVL